MSMSDFLNLIWNKLESQKIKTFSIVAIFLFYLIYNLILSSKISLLNLTLGLILIMSIGAFVSYVILEGLFYFRKQKNTFLPRSEVINIDYFTRVYILYYFIIIPINYLVL